jgi:hypothetical protein
LARRRKVQIVNGRACPRVAKLGKITRITTKGNYCPKPILVHGMGKVTIYYGAS